MSDALKLHPDEEAIERLRKLIANVEAGSKYMKPNSSGGLISVSMNDLKILLLRYDHMLTLLCDVADKEYAENHPDA